MVVRSSRSASIRHRVSSRDDTFVGEWSLSSEYLSTNPILLSDVSREVKNFVLASQAKTANAYTSLAIVAVISLEPRRRAPINSMAVMRSDRTGLAANGRRNEGHPQTRDAGTPIVANKDVSLKGHEYMIEIGGGRG